MKYIIEAIEDGIATLSVDRENRVIIGVDKLPDGVKEGDIVVFNGDAYAFCAEETEIRRKQLFEKQNHIFNKK